MTREEAVALLERYSNYDGMGIPNLAGCKEAMKVAADALKEVYPELAESEDERIRKWIVKFVTEQYPECWKDKKNKMLAYLEKQKENPKSADSIPSDCTSDAKCENRWHKVQDFTPADGRLVLAKDNIGNYLLASFDGGEWFVERYDLDDVPMRHTYVTEWCEIPYEEQKEPHYTKRNALFDKCVENCDPEVMKEVSDKVDEMLGKEQKPSLCDECKKKSTCLDTKYGDDRVVEQCINFVKMEQKPAEWSEPKINGEPIPTENQSVDIQLAGWSEEDEKMLSDLRNTLGCLMNAGAITFKTKKKFSNWLKSLRPHWKPSEEQMDALLNAEGFLRAGLQHDSAKTIAELYEQLKKLI